jgi:hypothetical protein
MPALTIKPAGSCQYDLVAVGEVMLRLNPHEGRVRTAREFKIWEEGRRVQRRARPAPLLRPEDRHLHHVRR